MSPFEKKESGSGTGSVAPEYLRGVVKTIEELEDRKKEVSKEITETYSEAKSKGVDTKILKRVIKKLKQSRDVIEQENEVENAYYDVINGSNIRL